jgi:hypothetical protein
MSVGLSLLFLLLAQLAPPPRDSSEIKADTLAPDGGVLRGTGHVEIRFGALLLTGDSGWLNRENDDLEVSGHARVTLPARHDHILIRCPGAAWISNGPVAVTADRLSVRAGLLLRGRGSVQAVGPNGRVEGDELDLFLKIADGDLRGNVRVNGEIPAPPDRRFFRPFRFPPDIIK